MTTVLLIAPLDAPDLAADLEALGIAVAGRSDARGLLRDSVRLGVDAVVAWDACPAAELLGALDTLQQHAALPVLLFTSDADAQTLAAALSAGVHAYVVNGYAPQRLRCLLQLASTRHARETAQRRAHAELNERFEERKLVDRAKGILMRARQTDEDEAFRTLRAAAMQEQQRVGQIARRVIVAARDAEVVNRAGQLRMLSQRLVKLYALVVAGDAGVATAVELDAGVQQAAERLVQLGRTLSRPTFGDLLDATQRAWEQLLATLQARPETSRLGAVDAAAERLLESAERLTRALEVASPLAALEVVNRAGRQRMLSQRLAKQALLAALGPEPLAAAAAAAALETIAAFEATLRHLSAAPLVSPDLRASLAAAADDWQQMLAGVRNAADAAGRRSLATASDALLARFEQLTAEYGRIAQSLFEPG
jgi:AmiR/NasT family two-component response regulator